MMRAHCAGDWCFANHGILAIDDNGASRLMNWSYRHAAFRDDVLGARTDHRPPVVCELSRGFARNLPLFWQASGAKP
jgi:hypothetical protein